MRPAINSTENPPVPVQDVQLHEYIQELRRRIELQDIQLEQLATDNKQLQTKINYLQSEVDKLSLDLHFQDQAVTGQS
jgi:hypothetical protein